MRTLHMLHVVYPVAVCPDRLFIRTDDFDQPFEKVYKQSFCSFLEQSDRKYSTHQILMKISIIQHIFLA